MNSVTWEITLLELQNKQTTFKVTRRFPSLHIAETKFFTDKSKALEQVISWSN